MSGAKRSTSVAAAVVRFSIAGLLALTLVGIGGAFLLSRIGLSQAFSNAEQITQITATDVQPSLNEALLRGSPSAIAALDKVARARVLIDPVVRIKIWTRSGTIVYSDQHRLIGQRYALEAPQGSALRTGAVNAELTDLSRPDNRYEKPRRKLLEVYLRIRATNGQFLLYETYQRYDAVSANGRRAWQAFAPILLGALILLELVQVPLAWSVAKRLKAGQEQREALLQRAIDAGELERRRIAADLHDGVVQELAAVNYRLVGARNSLSAETEAIQALDEAASATRQCIRELRSLLVEIYPQNLRSAGLEAALSDLLTSVRSRGVEPSLEIQSGLVLGPAAESMLYRTAQEAIRNVVGHAGAQHVSVAVGSADGRVVLRVTDDGVGFDPHHEVTSGHMGLKLVRELAEEAGGELHIDSAPGRGTTVILEVPKS